MRNKEERKRQRADEASSDTLAGSYFFLALCQSDGKGKLRISRPWDEGAETDWSALLKNTMLKKKNHKVNSSNESKLQFRQPSQFESGQTDGLLRYCYEVLTHKSIIMCCGFYCLVSIKHTFWGYKVIRMTHSVLISAERLADNNHSKQLSTISSFLASCR